MIYTCVHCQGPAFGVVCSYTCWRQHQNLSVAGDERPAWTPETIAAHASAPKVYAQRRPVRGLVAAGAAGEVSPDAEPAGESGPTCIACGDTGRNSKGGQCVPCVRAGRVDIERPVEMHAEAALSREEPLPEVTPPREEPAQPQGDLVASGPVVRVFDDLPLHYFDRSNWYPTGRSGLRARGPYDTKDGRKYVDDDGCEFVWVDRKGAIIASCSLEQIDKGKVKKPFEWAGALWVILGYASDETECECWELVPRADWTGPGEPTTRNDKAIDHCERLTETDEPGSPWGYLRCDPFGFYHGVMVSHGGHEYVIRGPAAIFQPACGKMPWEICVSAKTRQPTLF